MPPPHISSLAPSPSSFPAPCLPPSSPPPSLHTPPPFSSPTPSYSPAQVLFRCLLGLRPLSTFRHRSSPVPDAPSPSTFPAPCLPPSSPPPSLHTKSPLSSLAPSYSPAPVLFRCLLGPRPFSTFRHRPSSVPDAPSFFNIVRLNRTERRSFIRSDLSGRTKWPLFGQIEPNRGSLFGPIWPNEKLVLGRGRRWGRRRRGGLLGKGEEMRRKGKEMGRRQRRRGGAGEGEGDGAALEREEGGGDGAGDVERKGKGILIFF